MKLTKLNKLLISNSMRFKLSSLLVLLFLFPSIFAQKNVNVDNLRFEYWTRFMPKTPLNPMFFYYEVDYQMPKSVSRYLDVEALDKYADISGQRFTTEPKDGDYRVNVEFDPIEIIGSEVGQRYVEHKDSKGNVTGRTYYYWIDVTYTFGARSNMMKGDVSVLKLNGFSRFDKLTFKSEEFDSSRTASDYWRNNRDLLIEKFTEERAVEAVKKTFSTLSSNYGFPIARVQGLVKTINEKKHPENEPLRGKSDQLKAIMEKLNGKVPTTEEEMNDLIEYFKSIPARYTDPQLKADVRLRYVAYYNLCRIYIYLDQPEKVKEYADLLFENGHDKKDAERLIKDAEKLQETLNKSDIKATQFSTDKYFNN